MMAESAAFEELSWKPHVVTTTSMFWPELSHVSLWPTRSLENVAFYLGTLLPGARVEQILDWQNSNPFNNTHIKNIIRDVIDPKESELLDIPVILANDKVRE